MLVGYTPQVWKVGATITVPEVKINKLAHMVFLESVFSRAIDMSDSLRVRISCLAWRQSGFRG